MDAPAARRGERVVSGFEAGCAGWGYRPLAGDSTPESCAGTSTTDMSRQKTTPRSMTKFEPVIDFAASEARKSTASQTSSGGMNPGNAL